MLFKYDNSLLFKVAFRGVFVGLMSDPIILSAPLCT